MLTFASKQYQTGATSRLCFEDQLNVHVCHRPLLIVLLLMLNLFDLILFSIQSHGACVNSSVISHGTQMHLGLGSSSRQLELKPPDVQVCIALVVCNVYMFTDKCKGHRWNLISQLSAPSHLLLCIAYRKPRLLT